MKSLPDAAPRRNDYRDTAPAQLTLGGREIYRRTRWSPPRCNAVAALAGIGPKMEGWMEQRRERRQQGKVPRHWPKPSPPRAPGPHSPLDWPTWRYLAEQGVPDRNGYSDARRPHRGAVIADDGRLDLNDGGRPAPLVLRRAKRRRCFLEPQDRRHGDLERAGLRSRRGQHHESRQLLFDKSLYIHGSPWGWLQDRARGIYIIDWPQAFDRLRDVPRLAVAEPLLGLYQNHMRPKLPELFVLRVAA